MARGFAAVWLATVLGTVPALAQDDPGTYPITSFTWLLVYKHQPDATKAKKLADAVRWALTDGEKDAEALAYAPLPASLVTKLMPRIDSLTMAGSR